MKVLILFLSLTCFQVKASMLVKTTLPELNWVASRVGGELVSASALLSGHEDPHFVDVTPSFIFKIKKVDILIKNGLALESTWLPKIIELSGNKKLAGLGLCNASANLDTIGEIQNVDRSMGDVHPEGNPHYTYSPKQMIKVARAIANCFQKNDPRNNAIYEKNFNLLANELEELYTEVNLRLKKFTGINLMTYHEEFKYFCRDFSLNCLATLENTPGVLPSATNLVSKSNIFKKNKMSFVLATDSNPKRILKKFKEISGANFYQIEAHMNTKIKNYKEFILQIVKAFEKNGK